MIHSAFFVISCPFFREGIIALGIPVCVLLLVLIPDTHIYTAPYLPTSKEFSPFGARLSVHNF